MSLERGQEKNKREQLAQKLANNFIGKACLQLAKSNPLSSKFNAEVYVCINYALCLILIIQCVVE
jgi:hypothetical protein